jgi:3-isopropylmalate dehydrogenase
MARVAVLAGDGIGPEVTRAGVAVLRRVRPDVECLEGLAGGAALALGLPALPQESRELCDASDAILFGSVGLPEYDGKPLAERPEYALFLLRRDYELYANLRPVRVFAGLEHASSLKSEIVRGLDLVVVRELTGGIYYGRPKEQRTVDGVEEAVDTMIYRAPEIERIARIGFDLARARRKHLTSVDKQNILETSRLWRRVVNAIAGEYPDVRLEHLLVDTAAMQLVQRPGEFDVILTENMFGDILSDEAAILTGSIGTLPSASLGARPPANPALQFGLYEPIGGTAPTLAGTNAANPTASILSAAMLLRHSLDDDASALRIERAVERSYADGLRTAELAGASSEALSTLEFTEAVIARL